MNNIFTKPEKVMVLGAISDELLRLNLMATDKKTEGWMKKQIIHNRDTLEDAYYKVRGIKYE